MNRRSRTVLLIAGVLIVVATLPLRRDVGVAWGPIGAWVTSGIALAVVSASRRLDRWMRVAGAPLTIGLVLWLTAMTGGSTSPYAALYLPVVGFMAAFRGTGPFLCTLLLATVAGLLPAVLAGNGQQVLTTAVWAFAGSITFVVVHRVAAGLDDANRQYLAVLENHAGPTYVLAPDGTFQAANDYTQRILGLPLDELRTTPWAGVVAEGEAERLTPAFLAALSGRPQRITVETDAPGGRYQLQGTIFPLQRGGRVTGVMGITEDVTELRSAVFGATSLYATMDAIELPVAIFDADTREALYANHAARALTNGSGSAGLALWTDLHPDLQQDPPPEGEPSTVTIHQLHDPSTVLDVTIHRFSDGRNLQVFTAIDTSERARRERTLEQLAWAEAEATRHLREADRTKAAILTAVSHELRTPITVILGVADNLVRLRHVDTSVDRAPLEDALQRQARRLARLIEDLLDVDRLAHGHTATTTPSTFDLMDVVAQAAGDRPHPVGITIEGPQALEVAADPIQTRRIIDNLLDNTTKYAPDGPVTVTVGSVGDGGFRLVVADCGPGIPAHLRRRIFEPFFRNDSDHPQPGTGIGLALVAEFTRLQGGTVTAEPRDGGGTRMVVEIPRDPEPLGAPPQ